ncbi:protein-methionine-sulfoxide reductase heme-binding subunit MsrQ [Anaerolinea sp.]|uniref:sulfite oxidase heme-binding subunit YedZ n=1 Tax=Anaerolinea sp. TaxID=1872519 RepID=UPI002ACD9B1C|nr:protein-methionine-sulfoxide reductase heme-binding subunit MsrQ [Anaerolinea sp.]
MSSQRNGVLRILLHSVGWMPLIVLIVRWQINDLTINPIQAATRFTGDWALIFLLLSLACTPLSLLFKWRQALRFRRPLGLYAFLYASIHFLIYVWLDYGWAWNFILPSLREKPFILAGALALFILLLLALTSFDFSPRWLGKHWKTLHRLVYLAGILVILHFAWASKGDLFRLSGEILRPLIAGVILFGLLILRLPPIRRFIQFFRSRE